MMLQFKNWSKNSRQIEVCGVIVIQCALDYGRGKLWLDRQERREGLSKLFCQSVWRILIFESIVVGTL